MGRLRTQNKCNFHPNSGLFNTASEEEWNKMSEEFILKACISFGRRNTVIEKKWWPYWEN